MHSWWIDKSPTILRPPDKLGVLLLPSIIGIMVDEVVPSLRWILGRLQLHSWDLLEYTIALVISGIDEEHSVSSNGQTSREGSSTRPRANDYVVIFRVYFSCPLVSGPVSSTAEEVSYG